MASFVLVHGSGQNASGWGRVAGALEARGHVVAAPDLPKQAPDWGLEDYAAEIARSIVHPRTVVVGHSLSGAFLPLLPHVPDRGPLVFLAAAIPEPGKSIRDQFAEDPAMFNPGWIAAGARWFDKSQQESLAREYLFHDCDEETLAWALGTVDLLDTRRLVTQPAPFTTWPDAPIASVVATGDRTLVPDWSRRAARRLPGCETIEIRGGHCPHVSRPDEVVEILERLAARHAGSGS